MTKPKFFGIIFLGEKTMETTKLDYTLTAREERTQLVQKIIDSTPRENLSSAYLEILSDYILSAMPTTERKRQGILTDNRLVTINKRETSYQGLVDKLINGENGIYHLLGHDDKNIIFSPKTGISPKDIEEVPGLKQLRADIEAIELLEKNARGKRKYLLKKQLIEMRQQQYIMKNEYRKPIQLLNITKSFNAIDFSEEFTVDKNGNLESDGLIDFMNPKHISALLCHYSKLKQEAYGHFEADSWYLIEDLDNLVEKALADFPIYMDIVTYKIDGLKNVEIQSLLMRDYQVEHTPEYISALWRNKIPKLIAEEATKEYLVWYFTFIEKGKWKKCSCCGEIKLAHNKFFSKNSSSKDGWYSMCKDCRNARARDKNKKK